MMIETLAVGVGLGAIVAAAITYVLGFMRTSLLRVFSYVLTTVEIHDGAFNKKVISYLVSTSRLSPFSVRSYAHTDAYVRPLERIAIVVLRVFATTDQMFWHKGKPLWYTPQKNVHGGQYVFFRGTLDWEAILLAVAEHYDSNKEKEGRYHIRRFRGSAQARSQITHSDDNELLGAADLIPDLVLLDRVSAGSVLEQERPRRVRPRIARPVLAFQDDSDSGAIDVDALRSAADIPEHLFPLRWSLSDLGPRPVAGALENLALSDEQEEVVREIKFWHGSQKWYADKGIPWKRGYLFHGAPGTGKTSLSRAIAEELDLPVYIFDLASLTNDEMLRAWKSILGDSPCIALFEDIDSVFHGRDNHSGLLSFDCLLNCLDGIERTDGIMTIITTNNLRYVDPALGSPATGENKASSRPGRIDRSVIFGSLSQDGKHQIAKRILDDPDTVESMLASTEDETPAQFQERCFRKALEQRYAGANLKVVRS